MVLLLGGNDFCAAHNVTYHHRVFDPDARTWCPVPGGGADALLFGSLAVFVCCALYSRLSAVWVLLAGAAFALASWSLNLQHWSNALTLWLGMHPTFLFFQIFLPPLLLDSAVRLDFFLFKKLAAHSVCFAVVNVVLSTLSFVPIMLYAPTLRLAAAPAPWSVMDAALFGAMLGSTDAVAVAAILKAGGAPEMLSVLLEGESLFNDATSILLFEIFLRGSLAGPGAAAGPGGGPGADVDLAQLLPGLLRHSGYLMVSGAACGLLMGLALRLLYKLLHKRHVPPHVEVSAVLAGAYTVYLCTEYYVHGSGVIAVVVFGLYGASSYQFSLSSKGLRSGAFAKFFDVLSFSLNGMVFFFVGSSIVSFYLSLSGELFAGGVLRILSGLPLILAAMILIRGGLMWLEAPLLSLLGPRMSWQEVLFSAVGGLRGGLSLILVQTVVAAHSSTDDPRLKVVHAQMAMWVSGVVLFTLTVNAPLLGPLMAALGLNKTTPLQRKMHRGAYAALSQYTVQTIADLRCDDDEMLKGVDWRAVGDAADVGQDARRAVKSAPSPKKSSAAPARRHPNPSFSLLQALTPTLRSPRSSTELPPNAAAAAAGEGGPLTRTRSSRGPRGASRLAASSSSSAAGGAGGGDVLSVPLLSRMYGVGRERYGPDDDDEDLEDLEEGSQEGGGEVQADIEAPAPRHPRNSSEAFFIASRLYQQDQQLAQLTARTADCPFLNLSIDPTTAAAAAAPAADSDSLSESSALPSPAGTTAAGEGEEAGSVVGGSPPQGSPATPAAADGSGAAGAAAAAKGEGDGPKLQLLQPLIPVCISDAAAAAQQQPPSAAAPLSPAATCTDALSHSRWQQQALKGHSAADGPSAAAAAVAATAAAMAPFEGPLGGSRASFIAAASAATTPAGTLGLRTVRAGRGAPARGTLAQGGGGGGGYPDLGPKPHTHHTHHHTADWDDMSDVSEDDTLTQEQYLVECRASLLAGLKRHFRFKAAEGLLAKASLRSLEYACETGLSRPGLPLHVWKECGGEIRRWGWIASVASLHLQLRRYQTALLRQRGGCAPLRAVLSAVLARASTYLRGYLGKVAVTALEVALELWLALTVSPVAKLMRHSHTPASALLQEELRDQAAAVWRFIMDRQLEAPDEFAALQTHRVKLAVARRQLAFVERLAQVGAVDELTSEELQELLERRLHRLESRGPSWQNPSIMDVLRRPPFLAGAPEDLLLWLRAYGELASYQPGQCIIPRRRSSPPGVFIVLHGLVRVEVERPGGRQESRFVGVGGSVGVIPSVLGRDLPGNRLVGAWGQGNALGRGPTLLHLPMRLLATIRQRAAPAIDAASSGGRPLDGAAAAGSSVDMRAALGPSGGAGGGGGNLGAVDFAQLLLDLHRQVGVMLLDRFGSGQVDRLAQHLEEAAQCVLAYISRLPPQQALPKLQRLLQPLMAANTGGGSSSSSSAAAAAADSQAVADLIAAAFDANVANSGGEQAAGGLFEQGPSGVTTSSTTPTAAEAASAAAGAGDGGVADGSPGAGRQGGVLGAGLAALLRQRAAAAALQCREDMRGASLVTLAPGQPFTQTSTILLLDGSLRTHRGAAPAAAPSPSPSRRGLFRGKSKPASAAAASGMSLGQHGTGPMRQWAAPALLAWGPEVFDTLEDRYVCSAQAATAGPAGALLLVTRYTLAPTSTPAGGSGTDASTSAAAAAGRDSSSGGGGSQQQQQQAVGAGRAFSCVASRQQLGQSIAPAVEPDEEDV